MSFRNKSEFFAPAIEETGADAGKRSKAPLVADADNIYMVGAERVVRIVTDADVFCVFASDKAYLAAIPAIDATVGILLKADQEYFVSSSTFKFMRLSAAAASVELTKDRG